MMLVKKTENLVSSHEDFIGNSVHFLLIISVHCILHALLPQIPYMGSTWQHGLSWATRKCLNCASQRYMQAMFYSTRESFWTEVSSRSQWITRNGFVCLSRRNGLLVSTTSCGYISNKILNALNYFSIKSLNIRGDLPR